MIKTRISWKRLRQSDYTNEGPYLIAGKHINDNRISWDKCDHISMKDFLKSPEIILEDNDIIFTKDGTLGNPAIIKNLIYDATINSTMMLVRLDETVNPDYFFQVIRSDLFNRFIKKYKTGSGVSHILLKDMKNFTFPLPDICIQDKIVNLLSAIDYKLKLLKEKHQLYIKLKYYYMQILIPSLDRSKSSYHINKWDGWTTNRLSNVGKIVTGSTPSTNDKNNYSQKGYLWITPKDYDDNKIIKSTQKTLSQKGFDKCSLIPKGSICVTGIGTIGKVALNSKDCACNQQINAIIPYNEFDKDYIYYYILRNSPRLEYMSNQSVTPILNKMDFMNIPICYPYLEEQKVLGNFLSELDKKIILCKNNIKTMNIYKKSIMKKIINS